MRARVGIAGPELPLQNERISDGPKLSRE